MNQKISQVAQTLYDQIPPKVFREVKARDVVARRDGIQFRVKDNGLFNKIVITYDEGQDLYNMELWDIDLEEGFRCERVETIDGLFFDQLGDVIMDRVLGDK
jgi:hypothetical protein